MAELNKDDIIAEIGAMGVDNVIVSPPKKKGKPGYEQNTLERARQIVIKHQKAMESESDVVLMQSDTNKWDVASFTRQVYSQVVFHPATDTTEAWWDCINCPAKRFHEGDCKHILAVKIAQEEHIKIPTAAEAMAELIPENMEENTNGS